MSTSTELRRISVSDLVRSGRCTPEQGAMLLEMRRLVAWKRRPWWSRAIEVMARAVFG